MAYKPDLDRIVDAFGNLCMPDPMAVLVTYGAVAGSMFEGFPVHLFLIAPPASGKNEILEPLFDLYKTFHISTFNESSLLSGTRHKERAANATGGLLKQIGDGGFGRFILTEFNSVLAMNPDKRREALAALQNVCTGFLDRPVGADGGGGLHWHGKVQVLAACTESIEEHFTALGSVGERFIYCRLPKIDRKGHLKAAVHNSRNGSSAYWKRERKNLVTEMFNRLEVPKCPEDLITPSDESALSAMADFSSSARSSVSRNWKREIEYVNAAEGPARIYQALQRTLCGMRVIGVSNEMSLRYTARVALGSLPGLRRTIVALVADAVCHDIAVTVPLLQQKIPYYSDSTIRRALEELEVHGIMERVNGYRDYWAFTGDSLDNWCAGFDLEDIEEIIKNHRGAV